MRTKRTLFLSIGLSALISTSSLAQKHQIEAGKFEPKWESFINNYQCPEWFRDAKFGIWAHWSIQCVPEAGDWYARHMYIQGTDDYNYHVKNYGHPSKFGMMELCNLWKAKNWDPEKLMKLYKRAGAKYFVALANHHDNFDCYDSKYHEWNSVAVGPKKDIVGIWEKIARKEGLRFGVSNHSAHAWHWLQPAYGYDAQGSLAGVRYDAATLTKADGKGKWWDGLDPQVLYTGPNIKMPDKAVKTIKQVQDWHEKNNRGWTEKIPQNNPQFAENWFLRCQDLVDKYKPDLLYFDDFDLPMEQLGQDIVAHYYNSSMKWNKGKLNAVVNAKELTGEKSKGVVEDIERGYAENIISAPWQTCTCIGDWHYNKPLADRNGYKTVSKVVKQLIDIVSKNGNLLLSIPMKPDGTIDQHEMDFLEELSGWMDINGEAIFGTRPWKVFGEGPTKIKKGMFNENSIKFTPEDIRFTTKGKTLYAFTLGIPANDKILIKSLSNKSEQLEGKAIKNVSLLGYKGKLSWEQTSEGLQIVIPQNTGLIHTLAFKIK